MFPIIGILFLCFIPTREKMNLRFVYVNSTFFLFLNSLTLWVILPPRATFKNLLLYVGIEKKIFFYLTAIVALSVLFGLIIFFKKQNCTLKKIFIFLSVLDGVILLVLCVLDLLLFHIFFETILVTTYLIRDNKSLTIYCFFLYTLLGFFFIWVYFNFAFSILKGKCIIGFFFLLLYFFKSFVESFAWDAARHNFAFGRHAFLMDILFFKTLLLVIICFWFLL